MAARNQSTVGGSALTERQLILQEDLTLENQASDPVPTAGRLYAKAGELFWDGSALSTGEALSKWTETEGGVLVPKNSESAVAIGGGTPSETHALSVEGGVEVGGAVDADSVSATTLTGTLQTGAQPNVTSVGTLTTLTSTGTITGADLVSNNSISATGGVSGATLTGTLQTAAQPNITSLGTLTTLTTTGTATAADLVATDSISATGDVSGATLTGTLQTAAQGNITSVGELTSLQVAGNVNVGGDATVIGSFFVASDEDRGLHLLGDPASDSYAIGLLTPGWITWNRDISGDGSYSQRQLAVGSDGVLRARAGMMFDESAASDPGPGALWRRSSDGALMWGDHAVDTAASSNLPYRVFTANTTITSADSGGTLVWNGATGSDTFLIFPVGDGNQGLKFRLEFAQAATKLYIQVNGSDAAPANPTNAFVGTVTKYSSSGISNTYSSPSGTVHTQLECSTNVALGSYIDFIIAPTQTAGVTFTHFHAHIMNDEGSITASHWDPV